NQFERADSHGETILAAFENTIRGRNHERFIGIGICSIAHFTGLLRHQGRSALVTESLRVQLKNTKVRVFELAPPATQTALLGDFSFEDMKGVSIMKVEDMVKSAVKGIQADRFEIRPGQANQLKMMNRLAPGFILKQMSRSVDRMLRTQK